MGENDGDNDNKDYDDNNYDENGGLVLAALRDYFKSTV